MLLLNLTQPLTLLLIALATGLLIFLGQEIKRSSVALIPLIAFMLLLIVHVVQVLTLTEEFKYLASTIYKCIAIT